MASGIGDRPHGRRRDPAVTVTVTAPEPRTPPERPDRRRRAIRLRATPEGAAAAATAYLGALDGPAPRRSARRRGDADRDRLARRRATTSSAPTSWPPRRRASSSASDGAGPVPRPPAARSATASTGSSRRGDRLDLARRDRRQRRDGRATAVVAHGDRLARLGRRHVEGRRRPQLARPDPAARRVPVPRRASSSPPSRRSRSSTHELP